MTRVIAVLLAGALAQAPSAQEPPEFVRDVLPILEQRCFECHRETWRDDTGRVRKPKGGLRLDGRHWILRGGDGGRVLEPGRPEDSELLVLVSLPTDDPDVMPAEGEPLSRAQQETLRRWIAAGAEFGDWVGAEAPSAPGADSTPVPEASIVRLWRELGAGLKPLPDSVIAKSAGDGARVRPLVPDGPLLAVAFPAREAEVDDARIAKLSPLREHVADLDLGRTAVGGPALREIGRMRRLVRLDLGGTAVTSSDLRPLTSLEDLRSLVLFGTKVDDDSVELLVAMPALERVYVWQSGMTEDGVRRLRERKPELTVFATPELPTIEPSDDAGPAHRRRR